MGLHLRALTKTERDVLFAGASKARVDLQPYVAAVSQMRPDQAYAIELNGTGAGATKRRFNQAAKRVERSLRWARAEKGATELAVELSTRAAPEK